MERVLSERELVLMGLPRRYWNAVWDHDWKEGVFYDWITSWKDRYECGRGLMLLGGSGCGKSYKSAFIAKLLKLRGINVQWASARDVQEFCYHRRGYDDESDWFSRYVSVDCLVIDGMGSEFGGHAKFKNFVLDVVEKRSENMRLTIMNSSLVPEQVDQFYHANFFRKIRTYNDVDLLTRCYFS